MSSVTLFIGSVKNHIQLDGMFLLPLQFFGHTLIHILLSLLNPKLVSIVRLIDDID